MRILLVTPAPPRSRAGNRATAARWAQILRTLGHKVEISVSFDHQKADMMLALHAWRSAESIRKFAHKFPQRPLVVAITGTDAYRFIHSHPEETLQSIKLAHQLVGLHDLISNTLPAEQRHKMHVIHQSAEPIGPRKPYKRFFHVAVMGHLREEKDPMRPAMAVRKLPASSRIQLHHFGKACSTEWATRANQEMRVNPRYHWHQEVSHYRIRQIYQRTHVLVLPSRMEGGANVISEAIVAGIPVIASRIEGSVGLLGENYQGYYPVEDQRSLTEIMLKIESDPIYYNRLQQSCIDKQALFTAQNELQGWQQVLARISHQDP